MPDIDAQIKKLAELHIKQLEWMATIAIRSLCPSCSIGALEETDEGNVACTNCDWPQDEIQAVKELAGE